MLLGRKNPSLALLLAEDCFCVLLWRRNEEDSVAALYNDFFDETSSILAKGQWNGSSGDVLEPRTGGFDSTRKAHRLVSDLIGDGVKKVDVGESHEEVVRHIG